MADSVYTVKYILLRLQASMLHSRCGNKSKAGHSVDKVPGLFETNTGTKRHMSSIWLET